MLEDEPQYLIWSMEHNAWWAPHRRGYSETWGDAGRYTRDEAVAIVEDANGGGRLCHEAMIPLNAVLLSERELKALVSVILSGAKLALIHAEVQRRYGAPPLNRQGRTFEEVIQPIEEWAKDIIATEAKKRKPRSKRTRRKVH